jgi:hypothetical protein
MLSNMIEGVLGKVDDFSSSHKRDASTRLERGRARHGRHLHFASRAEQVPTTLIDTHASGSSGR